MVIELFSGNGDITFALRNAGISCLSCDFDKSKKPDIVADVYKLAPSFLRSFDFIWASPDCTTYSFASHGLHRLKGGVPVSDYAKECDFNNARFVALLKDLNVPFIIENPRAHLRHMPFMSGLHRCCVYYSSYGAQYSKPTDFFSNFDLSSYFDTSVKNTGVHLDYCKGPKDFLGRCKIPDKLVADIVRCISENKLCH